MEFLNSVSIGRLMLELLTQDDSKIYLPEVGIDLWDFTKSQISSKTQVLDYADLLKGLETLKSIVKSNKSVSSDDIEALKPLTLKFLECVSLLAIKMHIIKNMKIEATLPSVFYRTQFCTSADTLNSDSINLVDSVPYVDNLYVYMDLLKDNNISINLVKEQDLSHIDYVYLSMYLFIYLESQKENIVLRRDVSDAY